MSTEKIDWTMVNLALRIAFLSVLAISAVTAAESAEPAGGAKGMYYRQLQHPEQQLNNGMQYWIELKRGAAVSRVTSKFEFRSGDEIKLHVRPNTDGFAYVVLAEGSGGEHETLFPAPGHADDNRLKANIEYTIPADNSYLAFDRNPGTERLMVVLSRRPIDPKNATPNQVDEKDKVIIASRVEGSKDLVPGSCVVGYAESTGVASHQKADDGTSAITVVQKDPANALAVEIRLQHGQ
jgi:hypothetical protein